MTYQFCLKFDQTQILSLTVGLGGAGIITSIFINHLVGFYLLSAHLDSLQDTVYLSFLGEKKVPGTEWQIPLTYTTPGNMK